MKFAFAIFSKFAVQRTRFGLLLMLPPLLLLLLRPTQKTETEKNRPHDDFKN